MDSKGWQAQAAKELAETLHLLLTGYFEQPSKLQKRLNGISKTLSGSLKTGQTPGSYETDS